MGLRVIDSSFLEDANGYKSISTYNKVNEIYYGSYIKPKGRDRKPNTQPMYWEKYIELNRNSGKPLFEEDVYRSGNYENHLSEGTKIFETLTYRYVFEAYKYFDYQFQDSVAVKKGWQFIYEYPGEVEGVTSNKPQSQYWDRRIEKVSERYADSLLDSWGLKR